MSDITRALEVLKEDFEAADNLVADIYEKYFSRFFNREHQMYDRFHDADVIINDRELEWILISLPLEMNAAANALTQFKQHNEIVKLKIKQRKSAKVDDADGLDEEFKLMSIVYTSVITRVEMELSFSKELIMGAKKIWDARRNGETPPVGEIGDIPAQEPQLPDYPLNSPKISFE